MPGKEETQICSMPSCTYMFLLRDGSGNRRTSLVRLNEYQQQADNMAANPDTLRPFLFPEVCKRWVGEHQAWNHKL